MEQICSYYIASHAADGANRLLLHCLPFAGWSKSAPIILPPIRRMEQICSYYTASHSADGANLLLLCYTASHSADGANLRLLYCFELGGWSKSAPTLLPRARRVEQICSYHIASHSAGGA